MNRSVKFVVKAKLHWNVFYFSKKSCLFLKQYCITMIFYVNIFFVLRNNNRSENDFDLLVSSPYPFNDGRSLIEKNKQFRFRNIFSKFWKSIFVMKNNIFCSGSFSWQGMVVDIRFLASVRVSNHYDNFLYALIFIFPSCNRTLLYDLHLVTSSGLVSVRNKTFLF